MEYIFSLSELLTEANEIQTFCQAPIVTFKINNIDKRLGFYANQTIYLSPQLLLLKRNSRIIIVTHELAHYFFTKHSKQFKLLWQQYANYYQLDPSQFQIKKLLSSG